MITVVGLGFVGLTTALGFAEKGNKVVGIEINSERRETIKAGIVPFYEKGLKKPLKDNIGNRLIVNEDYKSVKDSEYVFFCVGTPAKETGEADLAYLFLAIDNCLVEVGKNKKEPPVFVIKSTVPPSTTFGKVAEYIEKKGFEIGKDIYLANNPEFLREGYCWEDFMYPGRIVVGDEEEHTGREMEKLYKSFNAPIHIVSGNTAEFIKYLSNSMLACMISFSNEMAEIAEKIGNIHISEAFHILHEDERWNNAPMTSYLYPGCGYGGYCLPKDTVALSNIAKAYDVKTDLLDSVIERNNLMPRSIANRIATHVNKDQTIGILGLSFKPGSDDVRACASAKVINNLIEMGYEKFTAFDPVANEIFEETYKLGRYITYKSSIKDVIDSANVTVILTGWEEFKTLKNIQDGIVILDYRYIL